MIAQHIGFIRKSLPRHVQLMAVTKQRHLSEIGEAVSAGVSIIGENYVQEAEVAYSKLPAHARELAKWHFIGHLQRNKVKRALKIFSCIQSVDSFALAGEIDKQAMAVGKAIPVLIEVNIGGEKSKFGVPPENVKELIAQISPLENVKVIGLMAMEPPSENPEDARPYFKRMKKLFEEISGAGIPNAEMRFLSMGMSSSYKVAIEEGSNMVRLGRAIFE